MNTRIALNGNEGNWLIGIGVADELTIQDAINWDELDQFITNQRGKTIFVSLSYDFGLQYNPIKRTKKHGLPLAQFWTAQAVFKSENDQLLQTEGSESSVFEQQAWECIKPKATEKLTLNWKAGISKNEYSEAINQLLAEIQYGSIYEINYCQEFFAEEIELSEIASTYHQLNEIAQSPFSLFLEQKDWMLASASPERFLKRIGNNLISQPIKGTARRNSDPIRDEEVKNELLQSPKERSENIMIVDLVRNDLSRIAEKGSVKVEELCGLYSFPRVHQLISTISCEVQPEIRFSDILKATFPMGSMTGAPKISAMQLSENHETFAREYYSGTVGYIAPNGDFDLNVIIRSFTYNKAQKRLSCAVGGAITIHSDADLEYEECKTKVGHLLELFGPCPW